MNNAVIYSRDNHDSEMDKLEAQIEECRKYAGQNGYQVIGCYTDTASGICGIAERPGWKALLDECRKGDVQCVVAASVDKIARDNEALFECFDVLENGAKLLFVKGGYFDTAISPDDSEDMVRPFLNIIRDRFPAYFLQDGGDDETLHD